MHGIREESEANDYYPLFCPLHDRTSPEASEILGNMVRTGRIDGLIINKEDLLSAEVIKMAEQKIPLVLINGNVPLTKKPLYSVCIDNFQGAYQAVKYLTGLGHQRIGFVNREYESIPLVFRRIVDIERLEGYKAALQKRELKYEDSLVTEGTLLNKAKVYSAVGRLMKLSSPPTAFFVVDDTMALSVIHYLLSKGLRIPKDVSVVGYGDLSIALVTEPSLTTVRAPLSEMGRLAVRMLIQILDGKEVIKKPRILLKPRLVIRNSCASVRKT
jgi:DNA-binding LacI/PurR family transcriptional regulator